MRFDMELGRNKRDGIIRVAGTTLGIPEGNDGWTIMRYRYVRTERMDNKVFPGKVH